MAPVADKSVLTLDHNQRKAVAAGEGAFLVIAGPGSGKTRVLTEREVRLIQEGLPPSSILAITFAKNASLEMAARVSERARVPEDDLKRTNCTFHALGYRILRRNSEHLPFELATNPVALGLTRGILKEICRDPYLTDGESIEYKMAKKYISLAKRAGQTPEESGKEERSQILPGIYKEYEKRKRERGLIDFDDMVFLAWRLLLTEPVVRRKESGRYKYVMVDEFHDTDRVQLQTAMILSEPENNFFAVADVNQCQPGDTRVSTPGGTVPISELKKGELVLSWTKHDKRVYRKGRRVLNVSRREFVGNILAITSGSNTTKTTPNHKFWARFNKLARVKLVVYLMFRSDRGFRVGWCKLFQTGRGGGFHLAQRSRLEKAEKVWILSVHDERKWASANESIISVRYGIPTVMFETKEPTKLYDESVLEKIFANADRLSGLKCLSDHSHFIHQPLWESGDGKKQKFHGYFQTAACNLLPQIMELPSTRSYESKPISRITPIPSACDVYSLDVEHDHTYIADGIPTCNSLYGWRGADPSIVVNFDKIYPVHERIILGRNYRSLPPIIDLYAEVIRPSPLADEKFLENIEPFREGHSAISFHEFESDIAEAVWLAGQVEADRANGFKMAAVLVRTNNQLRLVEQELYSKAIPYIIEGSSSFFSRVEVKGALAFLRIMENPSDDEALESIIRSPAECSRYLGNAFVNELKAYSTELSISLFDGLESIRCRKSWQSDKAVGLRCFINMAGNRCGNKPVSEQISFILDESGLMQKLEEDEELDESGDNLIHDNLQELVRAAEPFGAARKTFLAYTDSLTAGANRKYKSDDFPIRLMTVHKAKGLEFQTVYVAGVSQDILPHKKAEDIDEERRILYVAVSRAEDRLFISSFGNPSVFVKSKFPKKQVSPHAKIG